MSIESIRAVILFAIGDPAFRAELIERREEALAPFELSLDDVMLLETVQSPPRAQHSRTVNCSNGCWAPPPATVSQESPVRAGSECPDSPARLQRSRNPH
jgi:hypothetical protein